MPMMSDIEIAQANAPLPISEIASSLGIPEDVLEPYLIQQGYLQRTPRGRIATQRAYAHFGLERPTDQ